MVSFHIKNTDISVIEQFNLKIKVIDGLKKTEKKETKWCEFTKKIDGLFTPQIIEHLQESVKEARENFIYRINDESRIMGRTYLLDSNIISYLINSKSPHRKKELYQCH